MLIIKLKVKYSESKTLFTKSKQIPTKFKNTTREL